MKKGDLRCTLGNYSKEQSERESVLDGMANCLFELVGEFSEGVYEEIK